MNNKKVSRKKSNWFEFCPACFDWSNPGKELNLEKYVQNLLDTMQEINCDALVYVVDNGGYAVYNSKFMPKDQSIGEHDLLNMVAEETHKRGMKFVAGWMSQHDQSYLARKYPDWVLRDVKGNPSVFFWPKLCLNSPAGNYLVQEVEEVGRNYPIDGVYIEGNYMPAGYCYCDYCKAIFRKTYGYEIPTDEKDAKNNRDYQQFRMNSVTNFARKLHNVLQKESPQAVLMFCVSEYPGYDIESIGQYADMIMTERHGLARTAYVWEKGMTMQVLKSESNKPTGSAASWLSRFGDIYFSQMPSPQLKANVFEDILYGCTPHIHLLNHLDYEDFLIPSLREVNNHEKKLRAYLVDSQQTAYAALLHQYETVGQESFSQAFKGYYEALIEEHIPFEVVSEKKITEGALTPDRYKVLILPNVVRMSDAFIDKVKEYVSGGGGLVMTFKTSYADEKGIRRNRMGLASLAGIQDTFDIISNPAAVGEQIRVKEALPLNNHYRIVANHPIRGNLKGKLFVFEGSYVEIECGDDVQMIAEVLQWDYSRLNPKHRTWRFYPTVHPGAPLVIARENTGRVIYFAGNLDAGYALEGMRGMRELLSNAVRWAGRESLPVELMNPSVGFVELATHYNQKEKAIVILMINHVTNQRFGSPSFPGKQTLVNYVAPLRDIEVKVRIRDVNLDNIFTITGGKVDYKKANGYLHIQLGQLENYEGIVIQLDSNWQLYGN